jgi:hypothetical protein
MRVWLQRQVSAIVVTSVQATLVAKEATETIPIVFCTGGDRPDPALLHLQKNAEARRCCLTLAAAARDRSAATWARQSRRRGASHFGGLVAFP